MSSSRRPSRSSRSPQTSALPLSNDAGSRRPSHAVILDDEQPPKKRRRSSDSEDGRHAADIPPMSHMHTLRHFTQLSDQPPIGLSTPPTVPPVLHDERPPLLSTYSDPLLSASPATPVIGDSSSTSRDLFQTRPFAGSSYSSVNMMDLDESLRALYFAPSCLIILDHNRGIRLVSRAAEVALSVNGALCVGMKMNRFIAETSWGAFNDALNDSAGQSEKSWADPVRVRLIFKEGESTGRFQADLAVSSWLASDSMFSDQHRLRQSGPNSTGLSPRSIPVQSSTSQGAGRSRAPAHEAFYTLNFVPFQTLTAKTEAQKSQGSSDWIEPSTLDMLKENILSSMGTAIMAMSSDGSVVYSNRAAEEFFADYIPSDDDEDEPHVKKISLAESWSRMSVFDETFTVPFGDDQYPLVRAAIHGERPPPTRMGLVKCNGDRHIVLVEGRPITSAGGLGQHLGGLISIRDLTAELEARNSAAEKSGDDHFKMVCATLPQLVWITAPDGLVQWVSPSWEAFMGRPSSEMLGLGWTTTLHPDDLSSASAAWSQALRSADMYSVEYRMRRHDGCFRYMLARALPFRNPNTGEIVRWVGTCTDMHDQTEALIMARRTEEQLQNLLEHATVTIWAVDRESRIITAQGPAVRQLKLGHSSSSSTLGTEPEKAALSDEPRSDGRLSDAKMSEPHRSEDGIDDSVARTHSTAQSRARERARDRRAHAQSMIGQSIYEVWNEEQTKGAIDRAMEGENVVEEMEIGGRWFRTQYTPMHSDFGSLYGDGRPDEIGGVVGASMDITERKITEQKLREALDERGRLLASETAAKEASRLKSEFLANMSHEIRTPIAGVIGLAELLCDTQLTREQRDFADAIQRSADALLTVINDILDFSKVEIGKLDIEKSPFSLPIVIMDTRSMLRFATQKKGLEFREDIHFDYTTGRLIGDAGRLRQVLSNLLTNAIKFTSVGSITLSCHEVTESESSLTMRFVVEDTGCGISKDTLQKLFQPFSQADPSTARRFGGTGLGLTICKNLVSLMGGEIGLESEEGHGSKAWFTIPFEKEKTPSGSPSGASTGSPPHEPSAAIGASSEQLQRPRRDIWILVAEDNKVNQLIALKTLQKMGFSCAAANNGLEVLQQMEKRRYDLILMDCQMPEMDGYEATARLRHSDSVEQRTIPICAMTASAIRGDREKCLTAGMNDYLAKPVKAEALEKTLVKWLFNSDIRQSLSQHLVVSRAAPGSTSSDSGGNTLVEQDLRMTPVPDIIDSHSRLLRKRSDPRSKDGSSMSPHDLFGAEHAPSSMDSGDAPLRSSAPALVMASSPSVGSTAFRSTSLNRPTTSTVPPGSASSLEVPSESPRLMRKPTWDQAAQTAAERLASGAVKRSDRLAGQARQRDNADMLQAFAEASDFTPLQLDAEISESPQRPPPSTHRTLSAGIPTSIGTIGVPTARQEEEHRQLAERQQQLQNASQLLDIPLPAHARARPSASATPDRESPMRASREEGGLGRSYESDLARAITPVLSVPSLEEQLSGMSADNTDVGLSSPLSNEQVLMEQ